jgi:hypothetical protein
MPAVTEELGASLSVPPDTLAPGSVCEVGWGAEDVCQLLDLGCTHGRLVVAVDKRSDINSCRVCVWWRIVQMVAWV